MRKVSISGASDKFILEVGHLKSYISCCKDKFAEDKRYLTYSYDYGIIALYKAFEGYMYKTIVGCVNRDCTQVSEEYGVNFGANINDDVCEFIITKGGYFDFKGRDGLIKILKRNVGSTYGIVDIVSDTQYTDCINKVCALRNFAAHISGQAKSKAKSATGMSSISSAGSYLKKYDRFNNIADGLMALASAIKNAT